MDLHAIAEPRAERPPNVLNAARVVDEKTFATLQARAALLGCTLIRTVDDRGFEVFIVASGALCKELDSGDAISDWLRRLGGPGA